MTGTVFGIMAIVGMLNPLHIESGVIFDGKSVIIALAGLFGGGIAAILSALIAGAVRIHMGGSGALMGVLVIITSAAWGTGYHAIVKRNPRALHPVFAYLFELGVHANMLLLTFALPHNIRMYVLKDIAIPVITLFPLTTLFLIGILHEQDVKKINDERIKTNERKLRAFYNSSVMGIITANKNREIYEANDEFLRIISYSREDLLNKRLRWDTITPAEFLAVNNQKIKNLENGGMCPPYEKQFIHKNGHRVWVLVGFIPDIPRMDTGMAFVLDITGSKKTQEELDKKRTEYLEASTKLRSLYVHLNDIREHERENSPEPP